MKPHREKVRRLVALMWVNLALCLMAIILLNISVARVEPISEIINPAVRYGVVGIPSLLLMLGLFTRSWQMPLMMDRSILRENMFALVVGSSFLLASLLTAELSRVHIMMTSSFLGALALALVSASNSLYMGDDKVTCRINW